MRLLLQPQAKYRPTSHKPSRPFLPRDNKRKRLILQVISDPETPNQPTENKQPPSSPLFASNPNPKSTTSISGIPHSLSSTDKMPESSPEDQPNPSSINTPISTTPSTIAITEPTPHTLIANLNTEASRLEIGLLALGVLVLVAQMAALIWLGVRRRRKSAQWHQGQADNQNQNQIHHQEDNSRFASTAGLLFRSPPFSGTAVGVPGFLGRGNKGVGGSSWGWLRGKLGGGKGGDGKSGGESGGGGRCLFDEVFMTTGEEGGSPEVGGAGHHHELVLGPPTVIPVVSSSSGPVASAAGLVEGFRRRSSAIWSESIVPPVQVQMEVLMEIGRRLSSSLQAAGAAVVLGGGGKGDGGYRDKKEEGGGGYGYADEELSDSQSMTPPEERYHKDLEVGMGPLFLTAGGGGVTAATSSDVNDNRRFSLMPGLVSLPGGGLVRRTGMHVGKRVSFVEGLISPAAAGRSGSGGALLGKRRHSSFVFDRRGEVVGDEEEEGASEYEYGYEDREIGRETV